MKGPPRFVRGAQFRRLRKRLGLSQVRAAAICGVDETTVQRWEGGQTKRVRGLYLERLREGAK